MTREMTKSLPVSKWMVYNSYLKVIAKGASAEIDNQGIEQFHENLRGNLNKIWNNINSGSCFQAPVLNIFACGKQDNKRSFGVSAISDRIAQGVVKDYLEPTLENIFHPSSFGYRPGKSALDATKQYRDNCINYPWVLHVSITGFFDKLSHKIMLQLLQQHVQEKWIMLFAEGWLKAAVKRDDGSITAGIKDISADDVIGQLFANIYLHHSFDKWMDEVNPQNPFERYADDIVIHCNSGQEAQQLLQTLRTRMEQYKLELNPEETQIIYCKNHEHDKRHYNNRFSFPALRSRQGTVKNQAGRKNSLVVFCAAIGRQVTTAIRSNLRTALRTSGGSKKHRSGLQKSSI